MPELGIKDMPKELKLIHVIGLVARVEHFVAISDHRCATACEGIGSISGDSITLQVSSPGQT